MDNGSILLKAALPLNNSAGSGNTYIDRLQATIDQDIESDIYFRMQPALLALAMRELISGNFKAKRRTEFNGRLWRRHCLVYEYRPEADVLTERYHNKYKFKFA